MKYATAIGIKFVLMTAILWIILGLVYGVTITDIVITSLLLTITSFFIGDIYLLRRIGNVGSAMVDFVLAVGGIYALGFVLFEDPIPIGSASILAAIGITLGEVLVHWYLKKQLVANQTKMPGYYDHKLQTEFGEEPRPDIEQTEFKDPQE